MIGEEKWTKEDLLKNGHKYIKEEAEDMQRQAAWSRDEAPAVESDYDDYYSE